MTRERALEFAEGAIKAMAAIPTPNPASFLASAILMAIEEDRLACRRSAYAEADDEQVQQIGREAKP